MLFWVTQNSLIALLLAAIVVVLCRALKPSPALRHGLWLVVLIKLLAPPVFAWPWAVPMIITEQAAETGPAEAINASAELLDEEPTLSTLALEFKELDVALPSQDVVISTLSNSDASAIPTIACGNYLFGIWLAGFCCMTCVQLVRLVRLTRLISQGQVAPNWLVGLVKRMALKLQVRRPTTHMLPGGHSPFVWGLARSHLFWPASLGEELPVRQRASVVVHELSHLRRRDHWVGWLLCAGECVLWWNPLFWYVRSQLRQLAELACDAWVVTTLPDDRRAYAEALIEVNQRLSWAATPVAALGINSGNRRTFERRLTMIMRDRVPCRLPVLGAVALGFLGLAALPGWSQSAPAKKDSRLQDVLIQNLSKLDQSEQTLNKNVLILTDELAESQDKPAHIYVRTLGEHVNQGGDREKRLEQIEKQLQGLLKELAELRGGEKKSGDPKTITVPVEVKRQTRTLTVDPMAKPLPKLSGSQVRIHTDGSTSAHGRLTVTSSASSGAGQVIVLNRATYKLPREKAEALGKFLKDHVKATTLEIKFEGDTLTITTTPDAQKAIGGIASLMGAGTRVSATSTINPYFAIEKVEPREGKPAEYRSRVIRALEPSEVKPEVRIEKLDPIRIERLGVEDKPVQVEVQIEKKLSEKEEKKPVQYRLRLAEPQKSGDEKPK